MPKLYSNFSLTRGREAEWIHLLAGMVLWYNYVHQKPLLEYKSSPSEYWGCKPANDVCINRLDDTHDYSDFGQALSEERKKRNLSYSNTTWI